MTQEKCIWNYRKCEYRVDSNCSAEESDFIKCRDLNLEFEELYANIKKIDAFKARPMAALTKYFRNPPDSSGG